MYYTYENDSKINLLDNCVGLLLVALSFVAVVSLALLQVLQAIWEKRILGKIECDPVLSTDQNIQCKVHERQVVSRT